MTTDAVTFHPLTVADVHPETDDSVAITFDVPDHLADAFRWVPGQHVIVRAEIEGEDVRRSYSICSPAGSGRLRVGVKRIPGGAFSTWATESLAPGDVIEVAPPVGEFTHAPDPDAADHHVAIAAGSGITPILSIVATTLEQEPGSRVTLVYGNRTSRSIMFLDDVEALKDRFPHRFQVIHVLSREPHDVPLFEGRVDAAKLGMLLDTLVPAQKVAGWWLCGPFGMVEDARAVLADRGVADERIHDELFFDERFEPPPPPPEDTEGLARVTVTLDGRTSVVMVDPDGAPILDYARTVRAEVPFACKGGMCATCKAVVIEGEVRMDKNYALTDAERDAGLVLTCQSHPLTDEVVLSYDVHGGIGR
ncbi:MAG: 1,2-phenylacetyl-CoA epoxidase subunit PaaE [Acidimicrobiia bacterium]